MPSCVDAILQDPVGTYRALKVKQGACLLAQDTHRQESDKKSGPFGFRMCSRTVEPEADTRWPSSHACPARISERAKKCQAITLPHRAPG